VEEGASCANGEACNNGGVCVAGTIAPALVVGQDIPSLRNLNLGDGSLLRGQDVRALRDALVVAIGRINDLEARLDEQGSGISKANILPDITNTASVPAGAIGTATARCAQPDDIAIGCSCGGDTGPGTSGSPQVDQRVFVVANPSGGTSSCTCQGQNVGTNQKPTHRGDRDVFASVMGVSRITPPMQQ
jgi:hypothetical protein